MLRDGIIRAFQFLTNSPNEFLNNPIPPPLDEIMAATLLTCIRIDLDTVCKFTGNNENIGRGQAGHNVIDRESAVTVIIVRMSCSHGTPMNSRRPDDLHAFIMYVFVYRYYTVR